MYQGGVKLSDIEEEKCLKASPLTLAGIIKGPVEDEEGEKRQIRKRKRVEIVEVPKEPVSTTKPIEESDSEERGGYEVFLEQQVLSPTAEEATSTQARAEEKGKRRTTSEESSTSKLLILIQEIRDEMRSRDEQLREELR